MDSRTTVWSERLEMKLQTNSMINRTAVKEIVEKMGNFLWPRFRKSDIFRDNSGANFQENLLERERE